MIHIKPDHLKMVKDILRKYPYTFYAFGSRATGKRVKLLSDLDLCYFENIGAKELLQLEDDFEESDLPYKVDLVDWNSCNKEFQSIILRDKVSL